MKIALDFRENLEKNAQKYFEKAKKAKKKREGAEKALLKTKKKLEKIDVEPEETPELKERKKSEWYQKFHWFVSSDGFLVIGGKDAVTNEIIIKKYAEKDDFVFHTDMAGSPFVVVKGKGKEIPKQTLQEASDFTFAFSRAWKEGLATAAVFYVKPDQVTKQANTGEYLPKGSFMIRGHTEYVNPKVSFAVALYDGKVMGGPVDAIKKHCKEFIEIQQGRNKKSEIGKKIKNKIGGDLDEIIRVLPSGGIEIKS